ncbi:very-long-chain aldehyde decarbonylase CER1-like [Malania oleifera]|uniref:very-long-chain aldehyde decarbonylase CER1-like n=1 Tax=Malania oleifera TaxID=397392 RepID=UPI0025AE76A0|nr:very-long-chain aldehyde decarbonylase CER1-like [Malania oleifera]
MASKPGILTDWPWKSLGSFKYMILAPWVVHSIYSYFILKDERKTDSFNLSIFLFLLWRMLHSQLWISLSRYRTTKGNNRIVDKSIEFDQVDRERNWDDQILFNGIIFHIVNLTVPQTSQLPMWRTNGVVLIILLHMGPVEFLYYWFHRALHHHYLYSRYHSHHHSSIVTEPITSVIHPFAEHIAYFLLFAIPLLTSVFTNTGSIMAIVGYITYIDFMNNMGHCNFELIPKTLFSIFPPLKYLMYTPSFHSLHHTQFRTNYSLFMPIYDYIYGTMDKTSEKLYERSLKRQEESPNVVHLTHLTTLDSIYHLRLGLASLASHPHTPNKWYMWAMWPLTCWSTMLTWIYGRTFVIERNHFKKLNLQTWVIPKYTIQYYLGWQRESINNLIEEAILDAEERGIRVLSLGLLNQGEALNKWGGLYVQRNPKLKTKVVDGSSLAVAIVVNSIPKGATQVLLTGHLSKVASSIAFALCHKGIKVAVLHGAEYAKLYTRVNQSKNNLVLSKSYAYKTWIVGEGLRDKEQMRAPKGTVFIPFSEFPPKKVRQDCTYHTTPAMMAPMSLENIDSCENWLPRRAMSAGRVAGIVHALEEWKVHECGHTVLDVEKVWQASLRHGFHPLPIPTTTTATTT